VKIHPRITSTHRDGLISEEIEFYSLLEHACTPNMIFVKPTDNISAYDLLALSHMCLTSWGTMGIEAAKLGVPVVTGITGFVSITPDMPLFKHCPSKSDYYEAINCSHSALNIKDIILVCRWHYSIFLSNYLFLSPDSPVDRCFMEMPRFQITKLLNGEDAYGLNYEYIRDYSNSISNANELERESMYIGLSMINDHLLSFGVNDQNILADRLANLMRQRMSDSTGLAAYTT